MKRVAAADGISQVLMIELELKLTEFFRNQTSRRCQILA